MNQATNVPLEKVFDLMSEMEGTVSALEGLAFKFESQQYEESILQETLLVRNHIDRTLERVSTQATKVLGGLNYLTSKETSYLLLTCQLISFHPPSKKEVFQLFELYTRGKVQEISV